MADTKTSPTQKFKSDVEAEIKKIPPTSDQNMLAALSYVWIISLIMLLVKRNDEFIMHHARQGLILNVITLFGFIPLLGWLAFVLAVIAMVVGFLNAWQGKKYEVPLVYGWSQWLKAKGV